MTNDLHQLIIRLKKHNQWRRGEIELSTAELDPKQIGLDIDDAINYLEFLAEKHGWLAAQSKKYSSKYELISNPINKEIKPPEFISVNEGYYKD